MYGIIQYAPWCPLNHCLSGMWVMEGKTRGNPLAWFANHRVPRRNRETAELGRVCRSLVPHEILAHLAFIMVHSGAFLSRSYVPSSSLQYTDIFEKPSAIILSDVGIAVSRYGLLMVGSTWKSIVVVTAPVMVIVPLREIVLCHEVSVATPNPSLSVIRSITVPGEAPDPVKSPKSLLKKRC